MGIREKLNQNPKAGVAIAATLVVVAVAAAALLTPGGDNPTFYGDEAYFTDDDGQTYFAGPIDTVVPYTDGGKEVVRAHVFKCPSKGTFVAFLQRYTPKAQEAMKEAAEAKAAGRDPKDPGLVAQVDERGSEYKLPGAGHPWVRGASGDVVVGDAMKLCDNKPGEVAQLVAP